MKNRFVYLANSDIIENAYQECGFGDTEAVYVYDRLTDRVYTSRGYEGGEFNGSTIAELEYLVNRKTK